jgi:hypothetical protein
MNELRHVIYYVGNMCIIAGVYLVAIILFALIISK